MLRFHLLGVFFKSFNGTLAIPFSASLYQDNPGTAGLTYNLTGWVGDAGYFGHDGRHDLDGVRS